jgi:hypothetical protein
VCSDFSLSLSLSLRSVFGGTGAREQKMHLVEIERERAPESWEVERGETTVDRGQGSARAMKRETVFRESIGLNKRASSAQENNVMDLGERGRGAEEE